jgi:cytochrome c oxidase cbb3-type subunit II
MFGLAHRARQHDLGAIDSAFVPRYRVTAALVVAKGADGLLRHCYHGAVLNWLNDEQRAHFLRMGLVEEIAESEAPVVELPRPEPAPADDAIPELVDEAIKRLDEADVPSDAGAPTCRKALRDEGISMSNETIAAAVKQRRFRAS